MHRPDAQASTIYAGFEGKPLASVRISSYHDLFPVLLSQGIKIIGTTFFVSKDEVEGIQCPEFRTLGGNYYWETWNATQLWSQVAAGSARRDEMKLFDIASRISSGLELSEMRLNDLASSYSRELRTFLHSHSAAEHQRFKNTVSSFVYKDIHAVFWEMAVLRDALAEFFAVFSLKLEKITNMGRLRKYLKKAEGKLAIELLTITDPEKSGWLAVFGAYRDCFTHSAPLHEIEGSAWTTQDLMRLPSGHQFPQIYHPLPRDAMDLSKRRQDGPLFKSFEELVLHASRKRDRLIEPDALEYLHGCLFKLSDLAKRFLTLSPIEPEMVHIRAEDTVDGIRVETVEEDF